MYILCSSLAAAAAGRLFQLYYTHFEVFVHPFLRLILHSLKASHQ